MRRAVVLAASLMACARGENSGPQDAPPVGPVDAAIDGNGCATQPCSILPQCGCNGNNACDVDVVDEDGTACRPINMSGTEDDTCNGPNECDRGYVCLGGVSFRSCKKYCSDTADCGAPRGSCIYTISGDNGPIADVPKACSSNCDPVDTNAAGCPSSMKCTLYTVNNNGTPTNIVDCSPAGTEVQGDDCTGANGGVEAQCAKGYTCAKLTSEATYKCRRLCNAPGTTTGCNGQMCLGYTPAYTLAGVSYGVCLP